MAAKIVNRGRGPEIAGSRITVYDVLYYAREGWHPSSIALEFNLSSEEIQAALTYIEKHQDEVESAYKKIIERERRGNSPEIRAKLKGSRSRLLKLKKDLRRKPIARGVSDARVATGH